MKYAIIILDGRQLCLMEGNFVIISHIMKPLKTLLLFNKILLVKTLTSLYIGKPYLTILKLFILGEIIEHVSRSKLIIFKMRSKKKYRHHLGYRMKITKITIKCINE
uniref:Large ribosomal subunit protein bL21m n=1 Tax=Pteridomonas sp. YPF1301 TaxID=2766739 RepID=A0A7G1MS83_9STRA|nr:ribosomal protein L21 [Pteridomonas sp. YPF1301]